MSQRFLVSMAVLTATVLAGRVEGAGKEQIQQAINRGIGHLRQLQAEDGTWPSDKAGATALVGLTLLECDVPPADPAVHKAATYLRKNWPEINDIHTTYAISLAILFFDRLGDPADTPIIQALGVRLLTGQNSGGGWSYGCPTLSAEEVRRLKGLIDRQVELKTRGEPPKVAAPKPGSKAALPREVQQLLTHLEQRGPAKPGRLDAMMPGGDNSNTQFAILGLWAARRHGVPVDKALARTAARFRGSQHPDGGWGYMPAMANMPGFGAATPSMTCAGLLGLAMGYASARESTLQTEPKHKSSKTGSAKAPPEPTRDPQVRAGLAFLTLVIGRPIDDAGAGNLAASLGDMYYLLWSVERVAVAYDLPNIGGKDWYAWGAELLVAAQRADGGWRGKYGADVDTSFALLFLRRVNLSRDLTAYMKGADSQKVALKSRTLPGEGANKPDDKVAAAGGDKKAELPSDTSARPEDQSNNKPAAAGPSKEVAQGGHAKPTKPDVRSPDQSDRTDKPVLGKSGKPGEKSGTAKNRPDAAAPPDMEAHGEATRLHDELLKASAKEQEQVLEQLKQGKGAAYTEALAAAIPKLNGSVKTRARDALAERLTRMTPATLRDKLRDDAAEVRRAAALACAAKSDRQFVPDLATLLEDPQANVARAAHAALKDLTGQDLGPAANAPRIARSQAAAAWKEWWKKQSGKKE